MHARSGKKKKSPESKKLTLSLLERQGKGGYKKQGWIPRGGAEAMRKTRKKQEKIVRGKSQINV